MDGFIRSLPGEQIEYAAMLKETQGMFNATAQYSSDTITDFSLASIQ